MSSGDTGRMMIAALVTMLDNVPAPDDLDFLQWVAAGRGTAGVGFQ
jgi:hypothetical protein